MNYTEKQKQAIIENLEFQSSWQLQVAYDAVIDEINPECMVNGFGYSPSDVLKALDPVAYRCGFADWLDGEIRDGVYTDEIQGEYYLQSEVDELLESIEEDESNA